MKGIQIKILLDKHLLGLELNSTACSPGCVVRNHLVQVWHGDHVFGHHLHNLDVRDFLEYIEKSAGWEDFNKEEKQKRGLVETVCYDPTHPTYLEKNYVQSNVSQISSSALS